MFGSEIIKQGELYKLREEVFINTVNESEEIAHIFIISKTSLDWTHSIGLG